ncbi:MAG: sugar phosphate isomerase/epimerase [Chloroflexi bacterium]|nr:sugar phosphate isomerase/epimerase [Anaerolineae bacterium]RLC73106.1 MAG: sugar phosphate isomerase/epimerase [Chloroflexota bacterium]
MKIGVMSAAFPKWSLEKLATWASESGFQMLEIACWPAGEAKDRKYGGVVHIDVDALTPATASEINAMLAEKGLEISALGYYPNPLHPDPAHREHVIAHLKKVIVGAEMLGVGIVGTFVGRTWNPELTGRDWQKDLDYNFEEFMEVWPGIVEFAAEHNVKIAIEHCPMLWADTWPGGSNLPHSPALLHRMFEAVPDENFGLNFDPSHLVWQQIDYIRFIYDFGERIFHVHAKDMAIDEEMFYQDGILGCGFRWQIPRLPGQGLIDWQELVAALYDVGYDFVLSIEHEDRNWEKTEELVKRGFLLAKKTLELYTG